ncbi:Aldehyde dehydrogenase [Blyttiomyces sp. JEL0837]|nr:Aldehyde dehydrogenase [Blyttiomyces sp. JEL0837]
MSALVYTPVSQIPEAVKAVRATFNTNKTKSKEWRRAELRSLYKFCVEKEALIVEALAKDHKKAPGESYGGEILPTKNEIIEALENLDEWMAPEHPEVPAFFALDTCEIRKEPLGVALVIGAWNYSFLLTLCPVIAAIAAGNCVVVKPSEVSQHMAALLAEWLPKVLDPTAVRVINGGVAETTAVLKERFDHIFYTGNGHVGKIVMAAASKHLTPVVLELGGKSPVYVHHDVDMITAARRVLWAKVMNCGQTCIAPDYILLNKKAAPAFYEAIKTIYKEFFNGQAKTTKTFSRIINLHHFNRLSKHIDAQLALPHSKIVIGGERDADDLYIEPLVVAGVKRDDPLMEDELFGPVMPIVEVEDQSEAVEIIRSRDHPLALYVLAGDKKVAESILGHTNSGAAVVNDFFMNMLVSPMPFGGVQGSGMGSYHGVNGFNAFTHRRSVMVRSIGGEMLNMIRYPQFRELPIVRTVMDLGLGKSLPSKWWILFRRVVLRGFLRSKIFAGLVGVLVAIFAVKRGLITV